MPQEIPQVNYGTEIQNFAMELRNLKKTINAESEERSSVDNFLLDRLLKIQNSLQQLASKGHVLDRQLGTACKEILSTLDIIKKWNNVQATNTTNINTLWLQNLEIKSSLGKQIHLLMWSIYGLLFLGMLILAIALICRF